MKLIDRTGERYGRLVVISRAPNKSDTDTNARWNCKCDCGRMVVAYGQDLHRQRHTSCGCANAERNFKHGMSRTKVNQVWRSMRQRCSNPKDGAYANYGGRGIKVAPEWEDFAVFFADMGPRPEGHTLERKDNDGDYCKENCVWAPMKRQQNNKRNNHNLTYNGVTKTMSEWSDDLGLSLGAIKNRLARGWTLERALTSKRTIAFPTFKKPLT